MNLETVNPSYSSFIAPGRELSKEGILEFVKVKAIGFLIKTQGLAVYYALFVCK